MRLRHLIAILIAPWLLTAAIANPYEMTLKNGLRVIVKEDRRAPTVAQMVWYRIGSMDEVDGASGVAHVLEHMMFKGTPSVGPGEFNKLVAAAGGRDNAFTSRDYTAYFQQVPKEKLPEMMRLEADRMRHLNVDPKEFAQEIKVVMEERRMRTDDNPQSRLFEQMNAVAFQAHPYRRPIIGWMSDLENLSAADAKAWYDTWYVPNNAYVVIVGDVDHREVFALAEKYYGVLEGRALPARKPQVEPVQDGTRRVNVKAPAELPVLIMGYKAPVLRDVDKDVDPYALQMLAAILDGHDAARFNKKLVREDKVAIAVNIDYDATARGPGMIYLSGSPSEGRTVAELETALRAEIARLQKDGVSEPELKRARAQLVAAEVYKLDSMFGQAMEIGQTESAGIPYQKLDRMLEKLQQVTAAEVQAVAKKYFTDDTLTVGVLEPQPLDGKQRRPSAAPRH
ncbi:pitrilysin family protein [Dechloromonas sp. H13]|uniref:M16 family metallopeptidase n=1 Tax=Dechloromonas sp. H13 TaxID=2570193 RepID=UPI0012914906|nr:pitrilysin family protein [Dechloromonas sp. H13]